MVALKIFLIIYLILGFIYAAYILIKGTDKWFWFPINVVLGPLMVIYIFYISVTGKKLPNNWW